MKTKNMTKEEALQQLDLLQHRITFNNKLNKFVRKFMKEKGLDDWHKFNPYNDDATPEMQEAMKDILLNNSLEDLSWMPSSLKSEYARDTTAIFGGAYSVAVNTYVLKDLHDVEKFLKTIEAASQNETEENSEFKVERDAANTRLNLYFDYIPDVEVRSVLKRNGFKWSPYLEAWTRQLTQEAETSLTKVKKELGINDSIKDSLNKGVNNTMKRNMKDVDWDFMRELKKYTHDEIEKALQTTLSKKFIKEHFTDMWGDFSFNIPTVASLLTSPEKEKLLKNLTEHPTTDSTPHTTLKKSTLDSIKKYSHTKMKDEEKEYYVIAEHRSSTTIWKGTISHLTNEVFGYTLECGNSWNPRIPRYPKTIKSLVNALNNSASECNRISDYYKVGTEEDWNKAKANGDSDNRRL